MSEINWDNVHFRCSNCNQYVEYGNEDVHLKYLCPRFTNEKPPETRAESTRRKWEFERVRKRPRVVERDGKVCKQCGATDNLVIDHIVPIAKGGSNDLSNLQILCWTCNAKKGTK